MTKKQTSLVVAEPRDRIDKNLIIDFSDFDKPIPDVGIFDEPTRCHRINKEWAKLVFGFLEILADVKAWKHATDERYVAVQAIQNFMVGEDCIPPEPPSSGCIKYPTYHSSIRYFPVNPYTDPDVIPSGYLDKPFDVYLGGDPFPVNDLYDITVRLSSFPINASWFDLVSGFLPEIIITVQGIGEIEILLQNRPNGGRCAITIDRPVNLIDMFVDGIIDTGASFIELNQDAVSFPGESVKDMQISYTFDQDTIHEIHLTFCPTLDDSLIPFQFGGVFKGYNLCGLTPVAQGENIVNDIRISGCNIEALIDGNWIVKGSILACVTGITDPMQAQITTNTNGIANLQTQITSNDNDIADLQTQITSNDNDITNLQNTDTTLNGLITQNNDLIGVNAGLININDQRITTLENASGGGGGGTYLDTYTPTYLVSANVDVSTTAWTSLFSIPVNVKNGNIMVIIELKASLNVGGDYGKFRLTLRDATDSFDVANGTNETWVIGDRVSCQLNDKFENLDNGDYVIKIQAAANSAGQTVRIWRDQLIQIGIWDYGTPATPLIDPIVTFDSGSAEYNLTVGQVGSVGAGGLYGNGLIGSTVANGDFIGVSVNLNAAKDITSMSVVVYSSDVAHTAVEMILDGLSLGTFAPSQNNTWETITWNFGAYNGQIIEVKVISQTNSVLDMRLDNFEVNTGGV